LEALDSLSRERLIQITLDQHRIIEQLRAEIEQLKRRGGAAPFFKGTNKPNPKPPGCKPGQGFFRFRNAPEEALGAEAITLPVAGEILREIDAVYISPRHNDLRLAAAGGFAHAHQLTESAWVIAANIHVQFTFGNIAFGKNGAAFRCPSTPAAESALWSHPCVAISSAQVRSV
jgi:hypothetical protein